LQNQKKLKRFWLDDPEVYLSIIAKNTKLRLLENISDKFTADCFNKITDEKSAANLFNLVDNFARPWTGNTDNCIKSDFNVQVRLIQHSVETTINESAHNFFLLKAAFPFISTGIGTILFAIKGCIRKNSEKH